MVSNAGPIGRINNSERRASALCAALFILVFFAAPACAQIRGEYSPGSTLTGAGTVPDPGVSYSNQVWYGVASELKGSHGKSVPLQASADVVIDNNTLAYVPKIKILGASLEFLVDIAFSNGRYSTRDPFSTGGTANGGGAGLTNTSFVPLELGWHFKRADLQTGYCVYAPTGPYSPGSASNVSTGFWTYSWQAGATVFLTKSKATQLSIFSAYSWNTTQQGTGVHPGQNESLDYSLSQNFPLSKNGKWSLRAGLAGYGQWQTTRNEGQATAREELRYGVGAGGFTVNLSTPFKGLYFATSALWEYAARNTVQGRSMTFTAGIQF